MYKYLGVDFELSVCVRVCNALLFNFMPFTLIPSHSPAANEMENNNKKNANSNIKFEIYSPAQS